MILRRQISAVLAFLSFAMLACNAPPLGFANEAPPEPRSYSPQESEAALDSFSEKWRSLNVSTPSGPFSVTLTEPELTAALVAAIEQAEADGIELPPISNVSVVLENNAINTYATIQAEVLVFDGVIVTVPSIGANGQVVVEITEASFGPFELEDSMLAEISDVVEQTINAPIQTSPFNITVTSVQIANHELTINGSINP